MQHPQQDQFSPDPSLPRGQGDLEALERLKEFIKSNQHEIFRATPRPAALASLYRGALPSVPPHPEQIPNNSKEKPTNAPSTLGFETPSSSSFISDAHGAHFVSAIQGAPLVGGQSRACVPSISSDTLGSTTGPRDQSHLSTNGRSTSQQNADGPLHPVTSQLRSASVEQVIDANGSSVTVSLGSSPPPRLQKDSAFPSQDPLRRDVPTDMQRMQPQLLTSPERRNPGPDNTPSARQFVYTSDRDRPPLREMRPYDHERDFNRVQETHEQDRERVRERRGSLSDRRRFDFDRRSFDHDRRLPPDGRRRSSYDRRPPHVGDDRRPPQNDDSRFPQFEDKHPPSFVDRRMLDDRRYPAYEHRPLSEEVHSGNAPSQDRPQDAFLGIERRVGPVQAMKTHVPTLSSVPPSDVAALSMAPNPADSGGEGAVAGDHRPSVSSAVPMGVNNQGITTSPLAAPLEERSSQMSSLHENTSGTYSHLGPRAEFTRPGPFLEERPTEPAENPGATSSLPSSNQPVDDLLHTRVSEPSHATNLRLDLNDDLERYSIPTADNQSRPVSAAYSSALSVGRDESRPQLPPRASTPSAFSSTQPSPSLRAREPSRERPSNFRPFRSEFNRPLEDTRRPEAHSSQLGDRRYDERGRWFPPPYGDRRGYRDYYDRDRPYWDNKDRARVLPTPPESTPPYWDRDRTRYPEPSYTGTGLDRRFEDRNQGNRDRWYPPSYDNTSRRQFDRFASRGRPRSPGSPSREPNELRPPPTKRVRDDAYVGGHSATGDDYYGHPHHPPPPPPPPAFPMNKEPLPLRPPSVPLPVPIPISRPSPVLPPQPRYSRPPSFESYGGPDGGYEYDGGRGLAGPSYPRGPR